MTGAQLPFLVGRLLWAAGCQRKAQLVEELIYPEHRDKGYPIRSGTVESGCKPVATQRLKAAGAIRNEDGVTKADKARAALLSRHWKTVISRGQ